ncbi:putative Late embryogenesis abundant protein, LEA-14 [Lupinus albus]|uniref:Putative Late embryogenesis abundant protein, LEA-14 n=1 Tax=Lupinus albus TaxID=3870 RepID=A0A6A4NLX1_LUPAL|nr:putative Late embryogenesis abundant protein, LEA-14 [Lupinus albus]
MAHPPSHSRPKHLDYSVESAAVQNFNLTDANHLYANFDFTIRSYNPNSLVSIYYDKVEIYVLYEDQTLATNTIQSFFQSHKNVTRLQVRATAQTVALYGSVPKDIRVEKSSEDIELDLFLKAKIRFKVGRWKSKGRSMSVFCSPVLVNFSRDKSFYRTSCEVEI